MFYKVSMLLQIFFMRLTTFLDQAGAHRRWFTIQSPSCLHKIVRAFHIAQATTHKYFARVIEFLLTILYFLNFLIIFSDFFWNFPKKVKIFGIFRGPRGGQKLTRPKMGPESVKPFRGSKIY